MSRARLPFGRPETRKELKIAIYDAVIVGAGPNGLAAGITLARAGRTVQIIEARETVGGGSRSAELTLPGFTHDICSAIHPLGLGSPFFRELNLEDYGVEWIHPPIPLAHPLDDGTAVVIRRSVEETARCLGPDTQAYQKLMEPYVRDWEQLLFELLGPLRFPRHPLIVARFGLRAIRSSYRLAKSHFRGERARAVFAGMAGHSMMPLDQPVTAAFGLMLTILAHAVGWPVAKGGSQTVADALAACFQDLGGEIVTGCPVESIDQLPDTNAVLFDVTPRQLIKLAGDRFPTGYKRALQRYRYGPGVFKMDFALDGPIPWRASECSQAATVHVGGTLDEIAASERAVWEGKHSERPYILLAQQSLFDSSRAPDGKHTVWAYCHVPHGSTVDMTARIERQIERFAPGFRDRILARATHNAAEMEHYNPNYIGGDINGGVQDIWQHFTRPAIRINPYTTPARGIFICSSSTPPGGGVHGMCGHFAAKTALKNT